MEFFHSDLRPGMISNAFLMFLGFSPDDAYSKIKEARDRTALEVGVHRYTRVGILNYLELSNGICACFCRFDHSDCILASSL